MSGRCSTDKAFFLTVLLCASLFVPAPAVQAAAGDDALVRPSTAYKGEPIEITAERLVADNRAGTAVFEGAVVARRGNLTLRAEWMKVSYSDAGEVARIEARGEVRLLGENREITSAEAVYYRDEEKIVFTGDPVAREGRSVIRGSRMVYYIDEDRSVVDDSRVTIVDENGS